MTYVLQKIKERHSEGGIGRVLESLANKVKQVFSVYIYFNKKARLLLWTLDGPVPEVKPPTIDIEIRELKEDEIPHFKDIIREEKAELWRNRLKQGKVCLVAWHKGEVVWYGWVSTVFEYEPVFDVQLKLAENEGYILDAYTSRKYRGKNLHTYMSVKRLQKLRELGARKAFGIAATRNTASRRAHQKGGAVEIKEICHVNILGIKFHLWKDLKGKE